MEDCAVVVLCRVCVCVKTKPIFGGGLLPDTITNGQIWSSTPHLFLSFP